MSDPKQQLDYEITRGALRALALAAYGPNDRPTMAQVQLHGDHRGASTDGHTAVVVEPVEDIGRGAMLAVPAAEVLRLKSETARRGDLAIVEQREEHITVSVPTEIAVDGQRPRRRVEVHAVDESADLGTLPDVGAIDRMVGHPVPLFTVSVAILDTVLKAAQAVGATSLRVSRETGSDYISSPGPMHVAFLPPGEHERVHCIVMPMGDDLGGDEDTEPAQAEMPGTEARPADLGALTRRQAVRLVTECTSTAQVERWFDTERSRGAEARDPVMQACAERLAELGGTTEP